MRNKNVMKQDLQTIYTDMMEARTYCQRILEVLHSLSVSETETETNLDIVFLITAMPNSKYLKEELANIKGILRRLHYKNILPLEAYHLISEWYFQLGEALLCFNEEQILS